MFISGLVLDILVKATLLLLMAFAIDRILNQASAAVKHRLWGMCFVLLLLLPLLTVSAPQWRLAVLPTSWRVAEPVEPTIKSQTPDVGVLDTIHAAGSSPQANIDFDMGRKSGFPTVAEALSASDNGTEIEAQSSNSKVARSASTAHTLPDQFEPSRIAKAMVLLPICLWLFGVLAASFPLMVGIIRTHRIKQQSKQICDPDSAAFVSELCQLLGIRRQVSLIESQQSLVPMTWGISKPIVVLPAVWRDWMVDCQRQVLLHELAHVKRFDVLYHLIARIACSLYWFHPLVWIALRRMRTEREMACDDCVVMVGVRPSSYAQQLLNIARDYQAMDLPPAVAMAQRPGLEQRVRALLDKARSHLPVTPRAGIALLCVGLAFALLLAGIRLEAIAESAVSNTEHDVTAQATTTENAKAQGAPQVKVPKLVYDGKVVDANQVPVEGVKLFQIRFELVNFTEPTASPVAVTDANGQFRFEASPTDLVDGDPDWMISDLFAVKEGWGIAAAPSTIFETTVTARKMQDDEAMQRRLKPFGKERVLQLVRDDQPLEGRIINGDGQPVANATVRLKKIGWHPSGTLDDWIKATAEEKADYLSSLSSIPCYFYRHQLDAVVPPVKTDNEGRFAMYGIGNNRIVDLIVSGPEIEFETIHARTQDGKSVTIPYQFNGPGQSMGKENFVYHARRFTHVAAPSVPIIGRVTDVGNGKPIEGCVLYGKSDLEQILARTDADGRFQIIGMPLVDKQVLYVVPPKGSAFLSSGTPLNLKNQRDPLTLDLPLRTGTMITGQCVDKKTGEAISGYVQLHVLETNPKLKEFKGFQLSGEQKHRVDVDGRFSIAAIPGEGVLSFTAVSDERYPRAASSLPDGTEVGSPEWKANVFQTVPYILYKNGVHFYKELVVPDAGTMEVEVALESQSVESDSNTRKQPVTSLVGMKPTTLEQPSEKAQPAKSKKLVYEGTVRDPNKNAVADAKLYFVFAQQGKFPDTTLKPLATTDASGRFKFEVDPDDYRRPGMDDWKYAALFAAKDEWGVAWAPSLMFESTGAMQTDLQLIAVKARWILKYGSDKTLELVRDEQPIEGQIIDVDGQPVAGATLKVKEVSWNESGTLDDWEKAVKHEKADYYSVRQAVTDQHNGYQLASVIQPVATDANGRFIIRGIGNNRIVELIVSGPTIETVIVKCRTRDGEKVVLPREFRNRGKPMMMGGIADEVYYPRKFTYIAAPSIPIVGRVTDVETREPIADCLVTAGRTFTFTGDFKSHIVAKTDKDGRYKLEGLPLQEGEFYIVPPTSTPYLPWGSSVKLDGNRDSVTRDVTLRKGVVITGRAIDGRTNKPIPGVVEFLSLAKNSRLDDYKGFAGSGGHQVRTDEEGNYSITAVPGEGVLTFMALDHTRYQRAAAYPKQGTVLSSPSADSGMKATVPHFLLTADRHWVKDIVVPDGGPLNVDVTLSAGQLLSGQLSGEDGKPASEAIFSGATEHSGWQPVTKDGFKIEGYYPDKPRNLYFYQRSTNTAAYLKLEGEITEPIQVTLKSAVTLKGQIVDQDGAPMSNMTLTGEAIPADNFGDVSYRLTTDNDGRFEIRGLVPGQSYSIFGSRDAYSSNVLKDVLIDERKEVDLGVIKINRGDQN